MTLDQARARLKHILEIAGDDEAAHSEEDKFRRDVLQAIYAGHAADPAALAEIALRSEGIDFKRWCA